MLILSTPQFSLPLPPGHRFPMTKYSELATAVLAAGIVRPEQLCTPRPASFTDIKLAHDPGYVERVAAGDLTPQEIRRIGFPWTPELVARELAVVGATIDACRAALVDGSAVTLAGGTHHAHHDFGSGYCVFNDAAVAARVLISAGAIQRVAVIDCDVHQGDGTAAICRDDPAIWTFSIHGRGNFPFHKQVSDLDIALEDQTGDEAYLAAVKQGIATTLTAAQPQLVIYQAGADPFIGDRLGRLAITKAGLARRDALLFDACKAAHVPVATTMGGGYAHDARDTVAIHLQTVAEAARRFA
ncbi:MAG: histone deacetylase [Herpetosiphon sp.]